MTRDYELSPAELETLRQCCRVTDLLARIDVALADDDVTVEGSKGQLRPHPLLASAADQRRVLDGLLRSLALPMPDEAEGRRQSPRRGRRRRYGGVQMRRGDVVARWRERDGLFPPHLQHFREQDWPPAEGECLGIYACRHLGYETECTSLDGPCGWRTYAAFERDYPPAVAAGLTRRYRRGDAYERFNAARLAWLGEDHPLWLVVFLDAAGEGADIRRGGR